MRSRTFRPRFPVNLRLTLGPIRRGGGDPSMRLGPDGAWRATRTPDGPGAQHITAKAGEVTVRAWGPGADWLLDHAPRLVGAEDDDSTFVAHHPLVDDLRRRHPGLRLPCTDAVVEAVVPSILEQKVVGLEARRSYRDLVRRLGERAPGPAGDAGLLVPPPPDVWARTPSWTFHRCGVERKRADTVRLACSAARRLEAAPERMTALPGIGPWTAAEVALVARGDADAVSVGDYHLPHQVAWALAGEPRGDDERMLELLEPYRGHRGRVLRLLAVGG
ncbi:MAG TPA: hypothetical protein VGB03_03690, partial [Acidimicrobiales bacterium]